MKIIRISFLAFFIFLITYAISNAQDSYSDINPEDIPELPTDVVQQDILGEGSITIFNDEVVFNNTCGDLALEDFEDTNVGANNVESCTGPFNSLTNDACYSTGALIPGFSLIASPDPNAVLTPNFLGVTNVAAGPGNFAADTVITFTEVVHAVGMVLVDPAGTTTVDVQVFGVGNVLLGTATVNLISLNGHFLGILANQSIIRIEIVETAGPQGELLYELSFGQCEVLIPIPTLSEWGLIAMAGILGIIGFMVIRRRKVSA